MQFTKADGTVIVSDAFEVGREVNTSYSMALYRGAGDTAVGDVVAQYGDESFPVDSSALAELMVRGTTSGEQYAEVKEAAPTDGRIGLTAPANTIYTLNESDIRVDAGSVALLFDDIIEESKESVSRKEALIRRADRALSHTDDERHYELKYLDLVDTDNGNAWVKANGNVTVYWPLPEGTSEETIFTVLHFAGLHREMARDQIMAAIDGCAVEIVDARVKDGYVVFEIGSGGFSPFALVWHTPAGGSLTVSKTVSGDGGERDRDWHFTVTLDDATISGTYGSMTFEQGVSRFTLRHEQHVTAANLPAGMGYTVSEAEANTDGYQTTSVHHVGKIEGKGSITAAFFNQKDSLNIPTTGDAAHPKMWAALGGMALLSIVAMLAMSKRKDQRRGRQANTCRPADRRQCAADGLLLSNRTRDMRCREASGARTAKRTAHKPLQKCAPALCVRDNSCNISYFFLRTIYSFSHLCYDDKRKAACALSPLCTGRRRSIRR